jgi:hypothetical protein
MPVLPGWNETWRGAVGTKNGVGRDAGRSLRLMHAGKLARGLAAIGVEFPPWWVHTGRMIDQWIEQLRCPRCNRIGMASLSQVESDQSPTVLTVPVGFKVAQTEYGPDFHCGTCNVAAAP